MDVLRKSVLALALVSPACGAIPTADEPLRRSVHSQVFDVLQPKMDAEVDPAIAVCGNQGREDELKLESFDRLVRQYFDEEGGSVVSVIPSSHGRFYLVQLKDRYKIFEIDSHAAKYFSGISINGEVQCVQASSFFPGLGVYVKSVPDDGDALAKFELIRSWAEKHPVLNRESQ